MLQITRGFVGFGYLEPNPAARVVLVRHSGVAGCLLPQEDPFLFLFPFLSLFLALSELECKLCTVPVSLGRLDTMQSNFN